jgi:hypothetical protein
MKINFTLLFFLILSRYSSSAQISFNAGGLAQDNFSSSFGVLFYKSFQSNEISLSDGVQHVFPNLPTVISEDVSENFTVTFFPNPFRQSINLSLPCSDCVDFLSVIDINGSFKKVYYFKKKHSSQLALEQLDHLSAGNYYLQIMINNRINTYKVVKL